VHKLELAEANDVSELLVANYLFDTFLHSVPVSSFDLGLVEIAVQFV
jgi:hypothetical protein